MSDTIDRIEMAVLEGKRPRPAGSNARLGIHGDTVRLPLVRLTTAAGATGFGRCSATEAQLRSLVGKPVADLVVAGSVKAGWLLYELPLLDLAARIAGQPVYQLAGGRASEPLRVRTYDTSLYFDDLAIAEDAAAADLIAGEAQQGWDLDIAHSRSRLAGALATCHSSRARRGISRSSAPSARRLDRMRRS